MTVFLWCMEDVDRTKGRARREALSRNDNAQTEQGGQRDAATVKQFPIRLIMQQRCTACLQTGRRIQIAGKFSDSERAVAVSF